MRLQHAKQAASALSTDEPGRIQAKTAIVAEVERLHWRIWNGKAKNAQLSLPDLQQQVGAASRPAHLLRLVHPPIDQEVGRSFRH